MASSGMRCPSSCSCDPPEDPFRRFQWGLQWGVQGLLLTLLSPILRRQKLGHRLHRAGKPFHLHHSIITGIFSTMKDKQTVDILKNILKGKRQVSGVEEVLVGRPTVKNTHVAWEKVVIVCRFIVA
ncbi:3-isopropylmalate dehydratase small subunit [Frankliniella fusca]|uniref:3-isopropylmalate dehydratase small subunit n=1 Tax=Frankliniella fusca TaxID=407009 RepID=A0AAE1L744_9NEOP|nr:3-isopropylmalate dehydratase small subunit [Frankliniella fusca]